MKKKNRFKGHSGALNCKLFFQLANSCFSDLNNCLDKETFINRTLAISIHIKKPVSLVLFNYVIIFRMFLSRVIWMIFIASHVRETRHGQLVKAWPCNNETGTEFRASGSKTWWYDVFHRQRVTINMEENIYEIQKEIRFFLVDAKFQESGSLAKPSVTKAPWNSASRELLSERPAPRSRKQR